MKIAQNRTDYAWLIRTEKRCYCVNCNKDIAPGMHAWSYLANPVSGNYVECAECRYGAEEYSRLLRTENALNWSAR
jgi:RNase P subunit RPR2